MKKSLFLPAFLFSFLPLLLYGQKTQGIFRNYDFSSGKYTLYFINTGEEASDTHKCFYIDSVTHLQEIKTKLEAKPSKETFPCDYEYHLLITRNDSIVETGLLNASCGSFYVGDEFYALGNFQVFMLKRYGQEMLRYDKKFATSAAAKQFYKKTKNKCLFFPNPSGSESKDKKSVEVLYLEKKNCVHKKEGR